jgi:signal transduction histidine kinase
MPGTVVTLVLEVSALVFLVSRPDAFSGVPVTWAYTLGVYAAFPLSSLAAVRLSDGPWALRLLMFKALVLFWATLPEAALLPARWLVHGALAALGATLLPRAWRLPFAAGVGAELLLVQNIIPGMTQTPISPMVTLVVVVAVLVPAALLHLVETQGSRLDELTHRNTELHASVLQLTSANTQFLEQANVASEESAVLERHRITRDLHDVVGQTLTNIIMMMDAALHRKVQEPDETLKLFRWVRKQAQTGLEETRAVLYELRTLQPATLRGIKALKKLVETFSRLSGIKTKVEWGNLPWTFDPDQETAVYHLVQGSLSNAFRHGSATRIDLHFQIDAGVLHIMVRDNGQGGADTAFGLGQRGMEERLARWGGLVGFRSEPYGYVVTAALPMVESPFQEAVDDVVQTADRR